VAGTTMVEPAEQGPVSGAVPLIPIQHWFFAQELAQPEHFNQALLLESREGLDAGCWRGPSALAGASRWAAAALHPH
jgi:hypothetical protein